MSSGSIDRLTFKFLTDSQLYWRHFSSYDLTVEHRIFLGTLYIANDTSNGLAHGPFKSINENVLFPKLYEPLCGLVCFVVDIQVDLATMSDLCGEACSLAAHLLYLLRAGCQAR